MLKLENISLTFNKGTINERNVINNLSLEVKEGDFITIIGSNGAGKSTLFNLIAGTYLSDSGTIILDNENVTMQSDHKRAKKIGRLFQDPVMGSSPNMTIEENLCLAAGNGGWLSITSSKQKDEFKQRLSLLNMGLEDRMSSQVGLLSGGQRQALTLVMATYNPPKILLLDEHTAALDPATADKVLELTKNIVSENKLTCLMITHNMHQALELGNRTIMMDDGKIILDVKGTERDKLDVPDLLKKFKDLSGKELDNDRILLEK